MSEQFVNIKPGTLLAPVPAVMVSCALPGQKPNIITLAWVGTVNSEPPMCSISVRKERFSHPIIRESGEFIINLCGEDQLKDMDYCGVKSGRDVDKFAERKLTPAAVPGFTAPAIAECPLYLACKVTNVLELGSHDMFIGEVVSVMVRKDLLDADGKLHMEKAGLIAYSHGLYQKLGEVIGFFGWSVAREDVFERRMRDYR